MVDIRKSRGAKGKGARGAAGDGTGLGKGNAFEITVRDGETGQVSRVQVEARAADQIAEAVSRRLHQLAEKGVELTALGEPEAVAANIVERMPIVKSTLAEAVGPCYTSGSLRAVLQVSREALSKAVREHRALRLPTSDGKFVYPAFQVRNDAVIPGLRPVLESLAEGSPNPWTWATWLNTPTGEGPGAHRYIDQLAGGDVDGVVRDARQTAAAWAA